MTSNPYVFISYAHLDNSVVLPCVNAMKQSGINLWYDEGIEAGSEWPEFIAEKVVDCAKFVLFVSKAYLNSQNCKRELNFAISRKKDILSIFIEDVNLTPGMEMQLGTYQAIYRKRFDGAASFHNSLCNESFFNACRKGTAQSVPPTPKPTPSPTHTNSYSDNNRNFGGAASVSEIFDQVFPDASAPKPKQTRTDSYTGGTSSAYTKPVPEPDYSLALPIKSKYVAALLAIFLGGFGVHKFYLKQTKWGIVYLLLCWTYIPALIAFFEGVVLLFMSDEKFERKYHCRVG